MHTCFHCVIYIGLKLADTQFGLATIIFLSQPKKRVGGIIDWITMPNLFSSYLPRKSTFLKFAFLCSFFLYFLKILYMTLYLHYFLLLSISCSCFHFSTHFLSNLGSFSYLIIVVPQIPIRINLELIQFCSLHVCKADCWGLNKRISI